MKREVSEAAVSTAAGGESHRAAAAPGSYRPEIDGLRAVAVMAVILCHAHAPGFAGGYIGVDVFYVISGFLITSILRDEIGRGAFSLTAFYERRMRRILPALFAVLLPITVVAWALMPPKELRDFGQSLVAVNTFLSNVLFLRESGYFEPDNLFKPLLHTWSLAVEEQFYFFFPLLLFGLATFAKKRVVLVLAMIAVASLVLAEFGSRVAPRAAFYLLPTRAWEMLAGALLAVAPLDRVTIAKQRPALFQALSASALAMIAAAVVLFDDQTPIPGFVTVLPVLGAAMVIAFATPGTFAFQILANPVAVGIGLISYSAYLWHQPLFAFARLVTPDELPGAVYALLVLATLGLAYLSWRFVEKPFRQKSRVGRGAIFAGAAAGSAAFIAIGLGLHFADGAPGRFSGPARLITDGARLISPYRDQCTNAVPSDWSGHCVFGARRERIVAVLGDSHSTELFWRMTEDMGQASFALQQLTWNGAPPASTVSRGTTEGHAFIVSAENYILSNPSIDTVVLAFHWREIFNCRIGRICMAPIGSQMHDEDSTRRIASLSDALDKQVDAYLARGKRVILIGPIPMMPRDVPRHMLWLHRTNGPMDGVGLSRAEHERRAGAGLAFVARQAAKPGVSVIDSKEILCTKGEQGFCAAQRDGKPLYFDNNHLNGDGARLIAAPLLEVLNANRGE